MNNEYVDYIPDVHFELIPIKNLVSNQNYQRNLSTGHVVRTAEHFNLYQINPVKVSRREGVNYVFNGQHTVEAVALISDSRETPVWCMIYDDLDYEHEADIFANQMKFTKTLMPHEIFNANIEAGNDIQMTIKALVESYRLTITPGKQPGSICAISTLEHIFQKQGYHGLDRTLMLCVSAWEGEPNSLSSNMLKGVSKLISTFGDSLKDDLFIERMGKFSTRDIIRTAKERGGGTLGFAESLLNCYNKKVRYPLPRAKLYSPSMDATEDMLESWIEESKPVDLDMTNESVK